MSDNGDNKSPNGKSSVDSGGTGSGACLPTSGLIGQAGVKPSETVERGLIGQAGVKPSGVVGRTPTFPWGDAAPRNGSLKRDDRPE